MHYSKLAAAGPGGFRQNGKSWQAQGQKVLPEASPCTGRGRRVVFSDERQKKIRRCVTFWNQSGTKTALNGRKHRPRTAAAWQNADQHRGGQVARQRPQPNLKPRRPAREGGRPRTATVSRRWREVPTGQAGPETDAPRKRTGPDTQRRNLAGAPTNAARIKQPTENRRRAEPRKGSAARQRRKAHFACIVQQAERPPARRVTLVRDPLHAPHLKTA